MPARTGSSAVAARICVRGKRFGRRELTCAGTLLIGVVVLALPLAVALAQSQSASYQIPRQSVDAGAGRAGSASYSLQGSIGQPDAGPAASSPSYTLRGGFQRAASDASLPDAMFADGFEL